MRLIDADSLIDLVTDSTILGDGFKTAFCALVNGEPTVKAQKTGECIPSKAVKIFTEAYRKTQTRLYVKKPMSYAFYEVWKYYDRHEKPRW